MTLFLVCEGREQRGLCAERGCAEWMMCVGVLYLHLLVSYLVLRDEGGKCIYMEVLLWDK